MLKLNGFNLPIITTLHGTDITLVGKHPFYKDAVKFSIEKSNIVTSVSESLKNDTHEFFETRKKIEKIAIESKLKDFYICSFSSRSIVYKGMFLAEAISDFFLDLIDDRFISRYAIFHQRFSTNTAPSWSFCLLYTSDAADE